MMLKNLVLIIFFAGIIAITYIGRYSSQFISTATKKGVNYVRVKSESYFTNFSLYLANLSTPKLYVEGPEMVIDHDLNEIYFSSPTGILVRKDHSSIHYKGDKGIFSQKRNEVELIDNVNFKGENVFFSGNKFKYFFISEKLRGEGNIAGKLNRRKEKLEIKASYLKGDLHNKFYYFYQNVAGVIKRKRLFQERIKFYADSLSIYEKTGLLKLHNNVVLHKGGVRATAHDGKIFLENYNKKLKYYELSDDVRLKEMIPLRNGKFLQRKAYAEKLEGEIRRRRIVLTGFPKVIQSGSTLTGNTIILREKNRIIEVQDANSNFKVRD